MKLLPSPATQMFPAWSTTKARPECKKAASFWYPVVRDSAVESTLTELMLPVEVPLAWLGIQVFWRPSTESCVGLEIPAEAAFKKGQPLGTIQVPPLKASWLIAPVSEAVVKMLLFLPMESP